MDISLAVLTALGLPGAAAIVWSIRQEGRINGHDTLFEEREKSQSREYSTIVARLDRIESKVDDISKKV